MRENSSTHSFAKGANEWGTRRRMVTRGARRSEPGVDKMGIDLILVVVVGVLVTLAVLLRLFAPRIYSRYVLRGMSETADPSQSFSKVGAVAALIALLFICVHLGMHVLGDRQITLHGFATRDGSASQIQSWIALFCTSATGIVLCLFPVAVIRRLSKEKIPFSSADRGATTQIKIFGRLLGVIFLIGAVLIARSL